MLADVPNARPIGKIAQGVLEQGRSRTAILDFILSELPAWRNRIDRPVRTNETSLTTQLCAHLTSASRKSKGWDCLQFRVEEPDEMQASRKIDLVVAPAGEALVVEGRSYIDFQTILPIECKRLPVPASKRRDEREYVFTHIGTTGGMQRFKDGKHGAAHSRVGMIAYVQDKDFAYWRGKIQRWIAELQAAGVSGWSPADLLEERSQDLVAGVAVHESKHARVRLPEVRICHMWVKM